jgi:quinoprotein glucose dehydrogenase
MHARGLCRSELDLCSMSCSWPVRSAVRRFTRRGSVYGSIALLWLTAGLCRFAVAQSSTATIGDGWPTYGGDAGGTRFSAASQIAKGNLDQLHVAWVFHTHAVDTKKAQAQLPSFETTPVLSGSTLYMTSPFDVVFALDARSGKELWRYDPQIPSVLDGEIVASRGVALWPAGNAGSGAGPTCDRRVFLATLDARLLALDAATGEPCDGFGDRGMVDLKQGVNFQDIGFYGMTSPPTVVGNVVVVGSSVADSQQVDIESGLVRGFDAVTGRLIWNWEPLPWAAAHKIRTGAGNTWSVISADPALGLVYLPTGSAALDFYAANRPGDDREANSVVALDAATGRKIWAFQVVHHDVWDYDVASEPVLFTWRGTTPAVAVTTKMGMIFLLDRRTGQPLVPVEERPVPQSDVPGEQTSPTQPFQNIPPLSPLTFDVSGADSHRRSAADMQLCRSELGKLRYSGIYTPPSLGGTLYFPSNVGGVNWGGAAIDPATGILYANTNRIAHSLRLVPRFGAEHMEDEMEKLLFSWQLWVSLFLAALLGGWIRRRRINPGWAPWVVAVACGGVFAGSWIHDRMVPAPVGRIFVDHFGSELSPQRGSPYLVDRQPITDSHGFSCTPAPWGAITAVNLNTLQKVWEKPLGTMVAGEQTGIRSFGGPIVTGTGLVITAGAEDNWLRIFDAATGEELKKIALPFSAVSTPMTYVLNGRQYIVVAAGGHGDGTTALGDSLMAFAVN